MSDHASILRGRWRGEEERIAAIVEALKEGQDWTVNLGACESKNRKVLPYLDTCPSSALGHGSLPRDLRGICLNDVDLSRSQGLADSCLDYSTLNGVVLVRASLVGASLRGAAFLGGAMLDRASLTRADLTDARFEDVSLVRADFTGADLGGTYFDEVDLNNSRFRDVQYSAEPSMGFLMRRNWTSFGRRCRNARRISPDSDVVFGKYMNGEISVSIFRHMHPVLAAIWYWLGNFGRSPGRLLLWILMVWLIFGLVYSGFGLPRVLAGTGSGKALAWLAPQIKFSDCGYRPCNIFQPFYFSVVTLTTLGFGDITPSGSDWKAQLYVTCEALFGFVFLGAYVSLLLQNSLNGRD
jgi:hypothetical protein